ncbi:MAG: hypothetical protein UT63_C0022G0009 [Candidatus Gottesmanbacteria bacterium GW2011_GWC2_39_8]|uniref:Cohesin domain-containing protein n=1 Tax=Candidatus Gottesmanbacteria bacterium GW2011_GWC2_39_8 TaxID=1618450 RepID=A0A0G0Q778_9BACT|nr:MAG: hypothetical protein UT63_C0022G0009 [Candidatus Gottesmanbacteria bacterium GW2011_GWC2_39_8]
MEKLKIKIKILNFKISRVLITFLFFFLFLHFNFYILHSQVYAQTLSFDPSTKTVNAGDTLTISVNVDTGSKNTTGADALVSFDNSILEYSDVTAGTFYATGYKSLISPGKLLLGMSQTDVTSPKTGTGLLGSIIFRAKSAGTASLSFVCSTGKADSNIISSTDSSDVIDCSKIVAASYTVGTGTDNSYISSSTPRPEATNPPSALPKTGTFEVTLVLVGIGVVLTIIGGFLIFKG